MLTKVGVISREDGEKIQDGLDKIETEMATGAFPFREEFEDIHMNVEARLSEELWSRLVRLWGPKECDDGLSRKHPQRRLSRG